LDRTFNTSPTRTAPTQFKVGTGTTTPDNSDTDLVTPVTIGASNFKDFVSGYPVLDTSNNQVTIRGFVATTEANSNTLTEFGLVNEDGTRLLFSRAVHTSVTKTNTVEVTYLEKDKITAT